MKIDPELFFRGFLAKDPAYAVVAHVLDRLRGEMQLLLGRETLSLSDFVDMTSIEYDSKADVVHRDETFLKDLAKAMKKVDVTREGLKRAARSGLTRDQIAEGPTSIRVPVGLLCDEASFRRFVTSLSPEYRQCADYCTLIRTVCDLKVHHRPLFLLFDADGNISAYFYPASYMHEMRERILARGNRTIVDIYNAKTPLSAFCSLVTDTPDGHAKVIYLGRRKP